jgi:hypothetical protein
LPMSATFTTLQTLMSLAQHRQSSFHSLVH